MAVVRDIQPWDELLRAGREDERLVHPGVELLGHGDRAAGPAVLRGLHHEPLVLAPGPEQLVPGLDVSDDGHSPSHTRSP